MLLPSAKVNSMCIYYRYNAQFSRPVTLAVRAWYDAKNEQVIINK